MRLIKDVVDALVVRWRLEGITIRSGASEEDIQRFQSRYGVWVPEDLRSFFLAVDGLEDTMEAIGSVRFWPIDEVRPVAEECAEFSGSFERPDQWFVFADRDLWAWAYAIKLEADARGLNPVVLIGSSAPRIVAESFAEFVDKCLTDDPVLIEK